MGMVASSGWNAGGTWVAPDWAQKELYSSAREVRGPAAFAGPLPFPKVPDACPKNPDGSPQFFKEVAVLAVPKSAQKTIPGVSRVINLTKRFRNNALAWEVPEGEWVILRFICSNNGQRLIVPSPNSAGLHIDFLERSATERHLRHILERLEITPRNAAASGLAWLEFDSMELSNGITWTDRFPDHFRKWCGYDPTPYLPILAGWKIEGATEAFLYDHHKAVSEQLIYSHYRGGREFLRPYGIEMVAEAGGPGPPIHNSCSVDALKALGNVSVPRGEFWNRHRNMFLIKEISSAAHIYGQKYVSAESFTTWRRWMDGPFVFKQLADRALCEGLNQFVFHTFAHSPPEAGLPGRAYHAGMDLNPRATWWEKSRPFNDYLSRCAFVLQQGHFVADVCAYYGDQAPNFWPPFHDVPVKPAWPGLDEGYDYDVVNTDVILNRMAVKNGRITLPDGMSYRLLVLPAQDHIPAEVLARIAALVKAGATVLGTKPCRDPRLFDQERRTARVLRLANELWGPETAATVRGRTVGRGKVFAGISPTEALAALGVPPDFRAETTPAGPQADFIHRRTDDADFYFVRNAGTNSGSVRCHFRVQNRRPELWDPATGETGTGVHYTPGDTTTALDLSFAAGGSALVVFSDAQETLSCPVTPDQEQPIPGPWSVRFAEGWGAPAQIQFESLQSWTESSDEGIRYFSGTAVYERAVEIPRAQLAPGRKVLVDLGDLREVGEVFLNGESQGIVWKPPFQVDITRAARAGSNDLRIEVVNLWINRLQGDRVTKGKRHARTNQAPMTRNMGGEEIWCEQTSGLLGPVKLLFAPADILARRSNHCCLEP